MTFSELKTQVSAGQVDTVILVFPDVLGRLVGKRFTARFFIDNVAEHGTHGCNYLFTVDMEMEPQTGFTLANWEKGFGDFEMRPDFASLRMLPWQPGAVLVISDVHLPGGDPVLEAPRSLLKKLVARLAERGFTCNVASELEFFLYNNSYTEAAASRFSKLTPSSDYRIDYHTFQTTREESLFRIVRNQLTAARVPIESSKGEWGRGQHEVNFIYSDPIEMADMHCVFKQGIKEIAAAQNRAITFMAKPSMTEPGSSCHIHTSLAANGANTFWDAGAEQSSPLFRQFLGGLIKYSRELCYFFAPTINSYKRFQSASWAPTKLSWSFDNRTVGFRVVGSGKSFRIENRMPGADANPYLAFAATIAAGIAGIEENLDCGNAYEGNAYIDEKLQSLPTSLSEAAALLAKSKLARTAFGDAVVDFYHHTAQCELKAFANSVTDWELIRYFERI